MSPLFIQTILNVACLPCDPPHNGSAGGHNAINDMHTMGLIETCERQLVCGGRWTNGLQLTDKGRAYIEALQSIPLPITRYVIEWPKGEES